ncbi:SPRY domain-containing SOCS box protein 4 isoform X2 [Hippocampus zosterae]|uniref:SPRY domain-containing SOCS box protein 4 isoform X2 n=1 Tax=Hippocampus zosterae TaxID=109293 RepID=UPI00223D411C|nr:SPRY domain-containing SOCS box protein 4 isoform X2 [Hippocampus zosterae]
MYAPDSPRTNGKQFIPMGLSLSTWLHRRTQKHSSSYSSVFCSLAVPTSSRLKVILKSSPVPPGDSRSRWSSVHCSPHFLLSASKDEVTRLPVELSSDGVRAEKWVKDGLHVWEVRWKPKHRGSHAVLGVSRQNCPLQASGYNVLVGADSQSWGWELQSNQLWHDRQSRGTYPEKRRICCTKAAENFSSQFSQCSPSTLEVPDAPFPIPERIVMVLDADAGTLGFVVDNHFLGVAFKNLPRGVELFPAVSSVRGGACIRLRYLNGATRNPPALMALCGLLIHHHLGLQRQNQVDKLPLPPALQCYLLSSH